MSDPQLERPVMRSSIQVRLLLLLTALAAGCAKEASTGTTEEASGQPVAAGQPDRAPRAAKATADDPRRHTEVAGGFSFIPPDGWQIRTIPRLKFKVATGPAADGFAPNINIVDESFNGSVDDYAQANLANLQRALKQVRLLKEDQFTTAKGMQAPRMVIEHDFNGKPLHQTFYMFSNGATKFVITCSALAQDGDRLAPVFESAMRTFRFDRE
jgi:hypothetical protein